MQERFERCLVRLGLSENKAIDDALRSWVCDQELREARRPKFYDKENPVPDGLVDELCHYGAVGCSTDAAPGYFKLFHRHPFYGDIYVTDPNPFLNWRPS